MADCNIHNEKEKDEGKSDQQKSKGMNRAVLKGTPAIANLADFPNI
ncbi:MAG: hypothetical protein ACK415_11830 [Thermodesulfovibrionales bacterium]